MDMQDKAQVDAFSGCHPILNFFYFGVVLVFTMFNQHPVFLGVSYAGALAYSVLLLGWRKTLKHSFLMTLPGLLIVAFLNPMFNHYGVTMLYYIESSGNWVTLEALVYGIVLGAVMFVVIQWFSCYNKIMTSDKFIYLFGRIIPALSLILSMALRFVPRFINQLHIIRNGQKSMGRDTANGNILQRARHGLNILSILVTWALENAIQTSDSMQSRGYGLRGRTAFSIYRFTKRDKILGVIMTGLFALIVTGCMAQRYKEEITQEIPEVDAVLGTTSYGDIVKALNEVQAGNVFQEFRDIKELPEDCGHRVITTGGHFGYLKIAEGCDKHCTYCIIPSLRGKFRSVPEERLLKQAEYMASQGVRELILVAQETTVYGTDLYGKKTLHLLLKKLCQIRGIRWIRVLYCYPEEIYDELIQVMKEEPKICHYLDLPILHANDEILKRMGRRTTKQELIDIISKLRREIPDIALRTTLITGFPGETKEQHEELMEFVDEIEFDRLGVFPYSAEEDTPAATMEDQIPEEVKEARRDEIMELQQEISFDKGNDRIGQEVLVMIEGKVSGESTKEAKSGGRANRSGYSGWKLHCNPQAAAERPPCRIIRASKYRRIPEP